MSSKYIGAVIERLWEYRGFKCAVLMQALGYRTGYVAIPKGHKYYKIDYPHIPIECHGGLTYSEPYLLGADDKDVWWIGFDTAHYGDGQDYENALKIFRDYPGNTKLIKDSMEYYGRFENCFPARTLDYCMCECVKIVDQLLSEPEEATE